VLIEVFAAGPADTNGYLVADHHGGTALVIDAPQTTAPAMLAQAREWNATITTLVNTHAHWDHFLDNAALLRLTGAKFGIHRDSAPLLKLPQTRMFGLDIDIEPSTPDFFLDENQPLLVGKMKFEILHCPGHCPGSVALYERAAGIVFTGDVLFDGSIGRTDLPGGNHQLLLSSIREKLLSLDDNVHVFAGHGPVTTIGIERRTNPFLQGR